MLQELIVGILIAAAVYFIGRKIYRETFVHKVKPGCEKCDIEKK